MEGGVISAEVIGEVDSRGVSDGSSQDLRDQVMIKGADGGVLGGYTAVGAVSKGDADAVFSSLDLRRKLFRFQDQTQQASGFVLRSLPELGSVFFHHDVRYLSQQRTRCTGAVGGVVSIGIIKALEDALEKEVVSLGHQLMALFCEGEGVFWASLLSSHSLERHKPISLEDVQMTTHCSRSQTQFGAQLVYCGWLPLQQREDAESCAFHNIIQSLGHSARKG